MPIVYMNPAGGSRKRKTVRGSVKVGGLRRKRNPARGRRARARARLKRRKNYRGRRPKGTASYEAWRKSMLKAKSPSAMRAVMERHRKSRRKSRPNPSARRKRKGASTRSPIMARKKSKSRRRGRRRARHLIGKRPSRRRGRKSRARAAKLGHRRRRRKLKSNPSKKRARKRRRKSSGGKKRRSRRKRSGKRARRRGRKRRKSSYRRAALKGHRRKRRKVKASLTLYGPRYSQRGRHTLKGYAKNPSRRRRRRSGRRYAARRSRRRRSGFRSNPSGRIKDLIKDLAKNALPVVLSIVGVKLVTSKIAPRIPGIASLGRAAGPVTALLMVGAAHFATKKIGFLAKKRGPIMLGAQIIAVQEILAAVVPSSIKAMLGMGDYIEVGMSDYVAVDGTPIDDTMTLQDYVAVGSLEQELGLDQELGFTAELGDWSGQGRLGGMSQGSMLAPVPNRPMLAPVPARSFTEEVPGMTAGYDNADALYDGIFAGSSLR